MKQARSEILINILRHNFPRISDSKLNKLLMKLKHKWGIDEKATQASSTQEGETSMPTTLLFVDDNHDLVKVAIRYMNEIRPQWRFLLAHSLAEGRLIYNQNCPDAAVLDVELPDGSGLDLLSEFKLHRPSLPVIIISGDSSLIISQAVIERGGYSFLPKPFSAPVLVSHIESAISACQDLAAAKLELSPKIGRNLENPNPLAIQWESPQIDVRKPHGGPKGIFFK